MSRIFVSGPYTAPTERERNANVATAAIVGMELARRGHDPFVPHLYHFLDVAAEEAYGERLPYEAWMRADLAWVERSDGLLFLASSPGADVEKNLALDIPIPVYYMGSVWDGPFDDKGVRALPGLLMELGL